MSRFLESQIRESVRICPTVPITMMSLVDTFPGFVQATRLYLQTLPPDTGQNKPKEPDRKTETKPDWKNGKKLNWKKTCMSTSMSVCMSTFMSVQAKPKATLSIPPKKAEKILATLDLTFLLETRPAV